LFFILAWGLFAGAAPLLEAPLQRNPRDAEILRMCALAHHRAGHGPVAAHYAERADAIEPHPNTTMILAQAKVSAGETDEALTRCRTLLETYLGDIDARLRMARARVGGARGRSARGDRGAAS
jgi:thioredoxin-like negative regulator of GroEL